MATAERPCGRQEAGSYYAFFVVVESRFFFQMEKCYTTKLYGQGWGRAVPGVDAGGEWLKVTSWIRLTPPEGMRAVWWQIPGCQVPGLF